jgi:hypothetical protein
MDNIWFQSALWMALAFVAAIGSLFITISFGSISALFGLTNNIIDQTQYTVLLTAVIASAVVPTVIAQLFFQPRFEQLEEDA